MTFEPLLEKNYVVIPRKAIGRFLLPQVKNHWKKTVRIEPLIPDEYSVKGIWVVLLVKKSK